MFSKLTIAGLISSAVLVAAFHAGGAHAQYPAPNGNCSVATSATTTNANGSVTLTVTVRDVNGNLASNQAVTLQVTKQPGSDATVTPNSGVTNAQGQITATLHSGSKAGVVEVSASPASTGCAASVVVGSGEVASEVNLPNTGTGATAGGDSPFAPIALAVALAGAALMGAGALRRRAAR
jgi:hypothetical protein